MTKSLSIWYVSEYFLSQHDYRQEKPVTLNSSSNNDHYFIIVILQHTATLTETWSADKFHLLSFISVLALCCLKKVHHQNLRKVCCLIKINFLKTFLCLQLIMKTIILFINKWKSMYGVLHGASRSTLQWN